MVSLRADTVLGVTDAEAREAEASAAALNQFEILLVHCVHYEAAEIALRCNQGPSLQQPLHRQIQNQSNVVDDEASKPAAVAQPSDEAHDPE